MDKIKKIMIILLVGIIILIGIMTLLIHKTKKDQKIQEQQEIEQWEEGIVFESNENGFQILEDPNIFYSISNILRNYLSALYYDTEDIQNNIYNIKNEEEQTEVILSLLDEEYKENNQIDQQNIKQYVDDIENNYNIIPLDIRVKYDDTIITYILNVYLENFDNLTLENKYYIVRIDSENGCFSIEPILQLEQNIDKISSKNSENRIEKNDYNEYRIETISIERLVKIYMDQFNHIIINYPDVAYDRYLEEEYKEKRFGSLEKFKNYVEKNKEEIQTIRASQYLIENREDGKNYIVLDQYKNTYQFQEKSTMSYLVKLDTYTIPSEKFQTTYQSANNKDKVMMNVDKWIQMLNTRNYQAAYEVLNETFRNNTFGSEEKFETSMREKLPLHYKVEYDEFSEEGKTNVIEITLTDVTGESEESIKISIFMQLKEEQDFIMSFNLE